MKRFLKIFSAVAALALLAIVAAGCGSSNTKTTSSPAAAVVTQSTSAANATATTPAQLTTKDASSLGTILAGAKSNTVYLFEADKNGKSACNGDCAAAWPPVLTKGTATVTPNAKSSMVGTIKRDDGTTQVTYGGHPIYYFSKDKDAEDVYGQGVSAFGADWYTLSASGNKIEKSASSTSSSNSGGY
jgi:predicted lipoprotein with Yx(FWY)xxD motif